jgi:hypothetical protein
MANPRAGNGQAGPVDERPAGKNGNGAEITPELVSQIADRVMALLLQEMTLERERRRQPARRAPVRRGGW